MITLARATVRCPVQQPNEAMCMNPAGHGTGHRGYGTCRWHHGAWGNVEAIWRQAMDIAQKSDITPLEALLDLVRIAHGRVAWVDAQLSECQRELASLPRGDEGRPELAGMLTALMKESRLERRLAAQTSASAVQGGAMAVLVRRVEIEADAVVEAVVAGIDVLGLPPDQRLLALEAAQRTLAEAAGERREITP
jgi:hypothetical protein